MKTRLITNAKKKTHNPKSQTKIDNGVHPLHWATSLGPSPMGTDPINGFKWYKMVLDSAYQFSSMGKSIQDLFFGIIQIGF